MLDLKTLELALKMLDAADGTEAQGQQRQSIDPWEQVAQAPSPDNGMGLGL